MLVGGELISSTATAAEQELWSNLLLLQLDDPESMRPYSMRLSQEQGWSERFTRLVIIEYKKFLFLCVVTGHSCVPPVIIDAAWHLHTEYQKAYIVELCLHTLKRMIYHRPSSGGPDEQQRLHHLYLATVADYNRYFGLLPREVWTPCRVTLHREGDAMAQAELFSETPGLEGLIEEGLKKDRSTPVADLM